VAVYTATPKDWANGAVVDATDFDTHLRDFALSFGAFGAYTPTLQAGTTNPTLGTGSTASMRYSRTQKTVKGYFDITFGTSGTNAGSGTYSITLPVAASSNYNGQSIGRATLYDSSGSSYGIVDIIPNSDIAIFRYASAWPFGTLTAVTHAVPWAWGASDYLRGSFEYEAA
jgi:hypothetical protein